MDRGTGGRAGPGLSTHFGRTGELGPTGCATESVGVKGASVGGGRRPGRGGGGLLYSRA